MTTFQTIRVRYQDDICFIQIYRPEANNTINNLLVEEFKRALDECGQVAKIVVLEGLPDVFCFGADFNEVSDGENGSLDNQQQNPEPLYDVWLRLAYGPFVSIAHVKGRTNAGGVGFVAACDIVLCDEKAMFSLSELLFGLIPACVLPFLIGRVGLHKANYLTLMTQPVTARQAQEWGLADVCEANSDNLLRKHLLRLRRLDKVAITRYKKYIRSLNDFPHAAKLCALEMNRKVFSDSKNLEKITRFVQTGRFPWEEN